MAAFQWIETLPTKSVAEWFAPIAQSMGLEVVSSVSSSAQVYAVTSAARRSYSSSSMVSVLISWSDLRSQQALIEVRSDESMLRPNTRCKEVSESLKSLLHDAEAS